MKLSNYWAKDYAGQPFQAFGPAHLVVLLSVAALNVSWLWLGPLLGAEARTALRVTMAVVLLLNELTYHLWMGRTGQWTAQTMLPLYVCGAKRSLTVSHQNTDYSSTTNLWHILLHL